MECAGKGSGVRCVGPPIRRCARCGAVAYCSVSHQIAHWNVHKEECERLEKQMEQADLLSDFPFEFSEEATSQVCEKEKTRCSFLTERGIHGVGMWMSECKCGTAHTSLTRSRLTKNWNLASNLCPCKGPLCSVPKLLSNWKDYYEWRCIPLHSPVALLLHWPLTLYQAIQLAVSKNLIREIGADLYIHYLGPDKELSQLAVFGEMRALFPEVKVHLELVGPEIPQCRDGESVDLYNYAQCIEERCSCKSLEAQNSAVTLRLHKGYYHDRYKDITKDALPHLVVAPNAGVAAYKSWLPTIELIKEEKIPAVFTDYCEEACHLASACIRSITGHPSSIPVQLNPFRQPMAVEDSVLCLPCFSNCFLFGM